VEVPPSLAKPASILLARTSHYICGCDNIVIYRRRVDIERSRDNGRPIWAAQGTLYDPIRIRTENDRTIPSRNKRIGVANP
jgi:hypothetical protein